MPRQSEALARRDLINFTEECKAGGCTRVKCKQPMECAVYRQTRSQPGVKSYRYLSCVDQLLNAEHRYQNQENQEQIPSENQNHRLDQISGIKPRDQIDKLPIGTNSSAGEEELTLYDLKTDYFITFWTKKNKDLLNAIEEFDKVKSGQEGREKSKEIMKMIMSTPRKPGEVSRSKIKNLGRLQYEPIVWEGEKALKVFTTEPGDSNVRREAFILINKTDCAVKKSQEVTNQREKSTVNSAKYEQRSAIRHDSLERSHRSQGPVIQLKEGHYSNDLPGHDRGKGSLQQDNKPIFKEQPKSSPASASRILPKSRPTFTIPKKMAKSPIKKSAKTSSWKRVNTPNQPVFRKKRSDAGVPRKSPGMYCLPTRKKFPTAIRNAGYLHVEFKGNKKAMAARLAQAEKWASEVDPTAFKASRYPVEIFLPILTSKLSSSEIANFNIYFMASLTLQQHPNPSNYIESPRVLKEVEKERDERFKRDSVNTECSRNLCKRPKLCYGARAIKERGGSFYDQWYCYQPKLTKEEAIEWANYMQSREVAEPVTKKKVVVSPSFTSRQGSHLHSKTNSRERIYSKCEKQTPMNQDIKLQVKISFANQPHGPRRHRCVCHAN